jgi:hypothetical protein
MAVIYTAIIPRAAAATLNASHKLVADTKRREKTLRATTMVYTPVLRASRLNHDVFKRLRIYLPAERRCI